MTDYNFVKCIACVFLAFSLCSIGACCNASAQFVLEIYSQLKSAFTLYNFEVQVKYCLHNIGKDFVLLFPLDSACYIYYEILIEPRTTLGQSVMSMDFCIVLYLCWIMSK